MKNRLTTQNEVGQQGKNFGLSQNDFDQLIKDLHNGDNQLYRRVFLEHFDDCLSFLKRQFKANHQDAYDACMDALIVFCERLKKGLVSYGNLRFLFTQIAGQIYKRSMKKENRYTELPEEISLIAAIEEDGAISETAMAAFEKAWVQIGSECKNLLKSFFYDRVKLKDIAIQKGKNEATLRKQKQRCMTKLQSVVSRFYKG